jgi:hypothetical protein
MLGPVRTWASREAATAANTMVRWASVLSAGVVTKPLQLRYDREYRSKHSTNMGLLVDIQMGGMTERGTGVGGTFAAVASRPRREGAG